MSTNIDQILKDLGNALKASGNSGGGSAGIMDTSTREQVVISDNGVEVGVLAVERVKGDLAIDGTVKSAKVITTSAEVNNLKVSGKLEADTLTVKRLVSDESATGYTKAIAFNGDEPRQLDGLGFLWNEGEITRQFVYKADPKRIFSTESIDLYKTETYKIDGVSVISQDSLGESIINSKLRTVGPLRNLTVTGAADIGETLFVVSSNGRVGINTDQPPAGLTIVENNIEVVLGANEDGVGYVGTWGGRQFDIVTDSTSRISVKGNTVEFGNERSKGAVVKIHGSLEVDSVVSDTRLHRKTSLEFEADNDNSIFGKGLIWIGEGTTRQFVIAPNPDRLRSTESIDLAINKEYMISKQSVLNATTLGDGVINSSLTSVGTLTSLTVDGDINLGNSLLIENNIVRFNNSVTISSGEQHLKLSSEGITADTFKIGSDFNLDSNGNIQLGNKDNTTRTINMYGKLAVNVTNPDPTAAFTVDGVVVINGKKTTHGIRPPSTGNWTKGDIMWNTEPQESSFVGWICTMSGTPGTWKPFGYIGAR